MKPETNFANSDETKADASEIHRLPLAEAERLYREWRERRPGTAMECIQGGKVAERERWILEGIPIEAALNIARAYADEPKAPARPVSQRKRKRKPRKTAADFVDKIARAVADMKRNEPGSLEWVRAQKLACHYRVRAEERARAEGIEIEIPKIPTLLEEKYGRRPAARRKV